MGVKAVVSNTLSKFSGAFLAATFTAPGINPLGAGTIYSISADGNTVTPLAGGLDGIELLAFGPGGAFGSDVFVPTIGGAANADGTLYTLSPDGALTPFITGLDAVSVAFDTENILGGGMFIADINDGGGAGKIWRVLPPVPTGYNFAWLVVIAISSMFAGGYLLFRLKKFVFIPQGDHL